MTPQLNAVSLSDAVGDGGHADKNIPVRRRQPEALTSRAI